MVRSALRALQILELVGKHPRGLPHGDIARTLDIPKGTLTGLLETLTARSYLGFDQATRRYRLGAQVLVLAGQYLSTLDLMEVGLPLVRRLSELTEESAALAVRMEDEVVLVCTQNRVHPIMRSLEIGTRLPLYASATGKAMLAFAPEQEIEAYFARTDLARVTAATNVDPADIRRQLGAIRRGDLAYSREEFQAGVTAMAAPVLDMNGQVAASLVVSAPSFRMNQKKEEMIAHGLREVSLSLSQKLGYDPELQTHAAHGRAPA